MIGDIPPPLPLLLSTLLGWRWPRGPFCMPLRISSSPMSLSPSRPRLRCDCVDVTKCIHADPPSALTAATITDLSAQTGANAAITRHHGPTDRAESKQNCSPQRGSARAIQGIGGGMSRGIVTVSDRAVIVSGGPLQLSGCMVVGISVRAALAPRSGAPLLATDASLGGGWLPGPSGACTRSRPPPSLHGHYPASTLQRNGSSVSWFGV